MIRSMLAGKAAPSTTVHSSWVCERWTAGDALSADSARIDCTACLTRLVDTLLDEVCDLTALNHDLRNRKG